MGPRSDNRGYGQRWRALLLAIPPSMGPRSDNRGYVDGKQLQAPVFPDLQWVHGPITVVMGSGSHPRPGGSLP